MASGTTTYGTPYPTGTDLVKDGDNDIKALADAQDAKVYNRPRGKLFLAANSGSLAGSSWATFGASSFSTAYAKGGMIANSGYSLIVPYAGLYYVACQVYYQSSSATGFGTRRGTRIHLNGSASVGLVEAVTTGVAASSPAQSARAAGFVELATNDSLALGFYQDQTSGMIALGNANGSYTYIEAVWMAAL